MIISKELFDYVSKNHDQIEFRDWPERFKIEFNKIRNKNHYYISYRSTFEKDQWYVAPDNLPCKEVYHYRFNSQYDYELV